MEKLYIDILENLEPGGMLAREQGCICNSPANGIHQINELCPLHWRLVMVKRMGTVCHHIEKSNKILKERDGTLAALYSAILVGGAVLAVIYFFNIY